VSRVLERGDVFFFYRPRVGVADVARLEDVQRFFLVLGAEGAERHRRLIVGRKRLPDPRTHERAWAFVVEVAGRPAALLEPETRPAGEGRYALVDHGGHTHLAYVLELPREPGEAQRLFNIRREASFIVAVRNPDAPAPPGAGLPRRRRPELPPELLERFRGRRFIPVEPPAFLDHAGTEIVLIGAAEDAEEELGVAFDAEEERLDTADVFAKLRLPREQVPIEPLTEGELR
jgi:hypothetical protein